MYVLVSHLQQLKFSSANATGRTSALLEKNARRQIPRKTQVITFVHLEQVIEKSMKVPQDLKSLKNTTQFFFQTIQPLSKSPCVDQNLFGPSMQTTSKLLLLTNKSQVCDAQYYKIT